MAFYLTIGEGGGVILPSPFVSLTDAQTAAKVLYERVGSTVGIALVSGPVPATTTLFGVGTRRGTGQIVDRVTKKSWEGIPPTPDAPPMRSEAEYAAYLKTLTPDTPVDYYGPFVPDGGYWLDQCGDSVTVRYDELNTQATGEPAADTPPGAIADDVLTWQFRALPAGTGVGVVAFSDPGPAEYTFTNLFPGVPYTLEVEGAAEDTEIITAQNTRMVPAFLPTRILPGASVPSPSGTQTAAYPSYLFGYNNFYPSFGGNVQVTTSVDHTEQGADSCTYLLLHYLFHVTDAQAHGIDATVPHADAYKADGSHVTNYTPGDITSFSPANWSGDFVNHPVLDQTDPGFLGGNFVLLWATMTATVDAVYRRDSDGDFKTVAGANSVRFVSIVEWAGEGTYLAPGAGDVLDSVPVSVWVNRAGGNPIYSAGIVANKIGSYNDGTGTYDLYDNARTDTEEPFDPPIPTGKGIIGYSSSVGIGSDPSYLPMGEVATDRVLADGPVKLHSWPHTGVYPGAAPVGYITPGASSVVPRPASGVFYLYASPQEIRTP